MKPWTGVGDNNKGIKALAHSLLLNVQVFREGQSPI
jgi:hypothetical protein